MSGCMARSELKRLSWPWRTRPAMARPGRWHSARRPGPRPARQVCPERARVHCAQKPPRASKRLRPVPTIIDINQTSRWTTCPGLPATSGACARPRAPASQRGQSGPRHDARPRHPGRRRPPPRPRRCPRVSRGQHPARQPPVQPPPAALRRPRPCEGAQEHYGSKDMDSSAARSRPAARPPPRSTTSEGSAP